MDKFTLDKIELLHPKLREEAKNIYKEICESLKGRAMCRFAFTLRTFAEQDALYAQGRTKLYDDKGNKLGIVTKAKGGQSIHNYGLAIDIVLIVDTNKDGNYDTAKWDEKTDYDGDGKADWMEAIGIFKKYGWSWGGDWKSFKDLPHVEKTFGNTWRTLQAKYNAKKFILGSNYVEL